MFGGLPKKEISRLILRAPGILGLRSETISRKLRELELVLSGGGDLTEEEDVEVRVSQSTVKIARRVPLLLTQDIPTTVHRRSVSLRYLLMGGDSIGRSVGEEEDKVFERVLRRAPELLLLNVEGRVAPKLSELDGLVPYVMRAGEQ